MTRPTNVTGGSVLLGATGTIGSPTVTVAVGDLTNVDLSGLADGDILIWDAGTGTWVVGSNPGSGPVAPFDHGSMGATETVDVADGLWHRGTLTAPCTITVTGFAVDEATVLIFEVLGTDAITWDSDVDLGGDDGQPSTGGYTTFVLYSSAGDTDIKLAKVGGGSTIATLDDIGDVNAPTPSNGDVLTWDSTPGEWVAAAPTTVAALDDLTDVVITSETYLDHLYFDGTNWVNTAAVWSPVSDGAGGCLFDAGTGAIIMAFGPL